MTPETNHDTEISIYYDFLEDQGIIVDRGPEEQDQWIYEFKLYGVGGFVGVGGVVGVVGVGGVGGGGGVVGGGDVGVNISGSVGG